MYWLHQLLFSFHAISLHLSSPLKRLEQWCRDCISWLKLSRNYWGNEHFSPSRFHRWFKCATNSSYHDCSVRPSVSIVWFYKLRSEQVWHFTSVGILIRPPTYLKEVKYRTKLHSTLKMKKFEPCRPELKLGFSLLKRVVVIFKCDWNLLSVEFDPLCVGLGRKHCLVIAL